MDAALGDAPQQVALRHEADDAVGAVAHDKRAELRSTMIRIASTVMHDSCTACTVVGRVTSCCLWVIDGGI